MFSGSIVALVTPMKSNGDLDLPALERLIDWHLANGTHGIFVVSTTGEAPTLTGAEQRTIIQQAVKQVAGRIPVFAGTGTNCTRTTIEHTKMAMELGVDACVAMAPYYNRPSQTGLYEHFSAVAKAVAIPLIIYNVPSRTGCDLLPDTLARLADIPNIVGLKECMGVERAKILMELCGDRLDIFTGCDDDAFETMSLGYKGVLSVTANVAPKLMADFCNAMLAKQHDLADKYFQKLLGLHKKLFVESNPIPVKWAMQEMGFISSGIRLPLTPLNAQYCDTVRAAMAQADIHPAAVTS